jgi:Mg-chelatase subunit ChlD
MFYHRCTHTLAILFLLCISAVKSYAGFPDTIKVDSKSCAIYPTDSVTDPNKFYRITITGTYKMWPGQNGPNADAGYIFNIPDSIYGGALWPKQKLVGGSPKDTMQNPLSFNNSRTYWSEQSDNSLVQVNVFKDCGLRIDGSPLPNNIRYDATSHRYQIPSLKGNGKPFNFRILDAIRVYKEEGIRNVCEDNEGELTILIEEIKPGFNICDSIEMTMIDTNKRTIQIGVNTSILIEDTNSANGVKNDMVTNDNRLAVYDKGMFYCPDSIVCKTGLKRSNIAVAMIFDRSGSMAYPISENDLTYRIDAAKRAGNLFVDQFKQGDSATIISFSDTVSTDLNWTTNTSLMKTAINQLNPDGWTAFNAALITGVNSVKNINNAKKAIVILTDGVNNRPPDSFSVFAALDEVKTYNIPVYIIALGLDSSPESIDGLNYLKGIAFRTNGKLFKVDFAGKLDSIYRSLTSEITKDECCTIYYNAPPCDINDKPGTMRKITIYYPFNGKLLAKTIEYPVDSLGCRPVSVGIDFDKNDTENTEDAFAVSDPYPNPSNGNSSLEYQVPYYSNVLITVNDNMGRTIMTVSQGMKEFGTYSLNIDTRSLAQGIYHAVISINGMNVSKKMVIAK